MPSKSLTIHFSCVEVVCSSRTWTAPRIRVAEQGKQRDKLPSCVDVGTLDTARLPAVGNEGGWSLNDPVKRHSAAWSTSLEDPVRGCGLTWENGDLHLRCEASVVTSRSPLLPPGSGTEWARWTG